MMRRSVLLAAVIFMHALAAAAQEPAATVQMTIDYGDGVEKRFTALAWQEGMTVLDAMNAAQEHPRGVKFKHRGSGATAFLTQIDDLANEGSGRNWIYRVNDKLAERSLAVYRLEQGDTVLWRFEKSR